uniref:Uncharacterized protein n=1 Tax=Candidatus Kentrum sp. FW TaxID=2126338 RepID=A0A450U0J1_9GAMM|nr:MAG: hypothetical protein BECKFW1821C_GA0114237_108617 [Candidatus Kentron sp. FW]
MAVDLDADAPLVSDLRARVSKIPGYKLVTTHADAQMVLRPGKKVSLVNRNGLRELPPSRAAADPELWVLATTDHLYHPNLRYSLRDPKKAMGILTEDLTRLSHAHEIQRFADQGRELPPRFQLVYLRREDCDLANAGCREIGENRYLEQPPRPAEKFGKGEFTNGNIISFVVENSSREDHRAYLVDIAPDFKVEAFFQTGKITHRRHR